MLRFRITVHIRYFFQITVPSNSEKSDPSTKHSNVAFIFTEVSLGAAAGSESQSITAALRDLYKTMDKGQTIPPIILLQVLHMAFPRFAEKSEHGGYQQQDANECWIELMRMLQQKLPPKENTSAS